jgi:hypothetical protein
MRAVVVLSVTAVFNDASDLGQAGEHVAIE